MWVDSTSTALIQVEKLGINMQMPLFIFNPAELQARSFYLNLFK